MMSTAVSGRVEVRLQRLAEVAAEAGARSGMAAVAAWTRYADEVRDAVNHFRALEVADLVYLHGFRLREIADEVAEALGGSMSRQAVAEWLARHGPRHYAVVTRTGGRHELRWIPVLGLVQTRRELAAVLDSGGRAAPARWELNPDDDLDAAALWQRLAEQ